MKDWIEIIVVYSFLWQCLPCHGLTMKLGLTLWFFLYYLILRSKHLTYFFLCVIVVQHLLICTEVGKAWPSRAGCWLDLGAGSGVWILLSLCTKGFDRKRWDKIALSACSEWYWLLSQDCCLGIWFRILLSYERDVYFEAGSPEIWVCLSHFTAHCPNYPTVARGAFCLSSLVTTKSKMIHTPLNMLFSQVSPRTFCLVSHHHLEQQSVGWVFSCLKSL